MIPLSNEWLRHHKLKWDPHATGTPRYTHVPSGRAVVRHSWMVRDDQWADAVIHFARECGSGRKEHYMTGGRLSVNAECPTCFTRLDGAVNPDGVASPGPGDVTVCAYCQTILVYEPDMQLRRASETEIEEMPTNMRMTLMGLVEHFQKLKLKPGDHLTPETVLEGTRP